MPAYDEVGSLERVVDEALAALAEIGSGEVLIVDDGSRDGTARLADSLAARHAGVRAVHHERNRGFSGAMSTCFRQARGDWVFLAPADGQTPIAELPRFLAAAGGADVVVGVRDGRSEGIARKLLSRSFHAIARALFDLPQREFSSVFLFRRSLLDAMPFRSASRSASLLPEILYRAKARGARLVEVEVAQRPRFAGRAKGGQLSVAALTLVELARVAALVRLEEWRRARRVAKSAMRID